MLTMVLSGF